MRLELNTQRIIGSNECPQASESPMLPTLLNWKFWELNNLIVSFRRRWRWIPLSTHLMMRTRGNIFLSSKLCYNGKMSKHSTPIAIIQPWNGNGITKKLRAQSFTIKRPTRRKGTFKAFNFQSCPLTMWTLYHDESDHCRRKFSGLCYLAHVWGADSSLLSSTQLRMYFQGHLFTWTTV